MTAIHSGEGNRWKTPGKAESPMKLSLCVIGCGGYAKTVLSEICDMTDELELYFASRNINKAREYSELYGGAGFFGSYEEAVRD